jgi:DNA-binding beta-propeller fold protein YncE
MVARGAASPEAAPTVPGIAGEAPTHTAQVSPPTGLIAASHIHAPPPPSRRRRAPLVAALTVVLAGAGAAVALALKDDAPQAARGGPLPTPTPTATPTPTPTADAPRARTVRGVGNRPSGIAIAGDDVWVASTRSEWITRVSRATMKERRRHPKVGRTATALIAHQGSVWVATVDPPQVVKLDARSGARRGSIPLPAKPVRLAVDANGVWVAVQDTPGRTPQRLLRYDRATGELAQTIMVPEGISALVAGDGDIWIVKAALHRLARLTPGSTTAENWLTLPGVPMTMRYGAGALWVTLRDDDTLVRVSLDDRNTATAGTGHDPMQAAVAGDHVYVSSRGDQAVDVLDRVRLKPVGEPIEVGLNPYAIAADRRYVWVTGLGDDTLTRIEQR